MALGKGMKSLFPESSMDDTGIKEIELTEIVPNPAQPRQEISEEELGELTESVKLYGVIEPVILRKKEDHYEIIAGERRWRAANLAKLERIPAIIKDLNDTEALELSIIENIQRENLNPMELAMGYEKLIEDFDYTQQQLADRLTKSRASIANTLRLLNLPEEIQKLVLQNKISQGSARALLSVKDPELQKQIAEKIQEEDLTTREVERLAQQQQKPKPPEPKEVEQDPFITDIENNLSSKFDTRVTVKQGKKKGSIQIFYTTPEKLNDILELIGYHESLE